MIQRVAPQVQSQDGIHPRRLDAAPAAVGFLSLHDPPLGFAQGVFAKGGEGRGGHQLLVGEAEQLVKALQRAAPSGQRELLSLSGGGICVQLADGEGQRASRAVGAYDGERHDGLAGPAGEVVDIQREPRRQQDHFGQQSGKLVPRPFAEERHPDASEDSGALQTARIQDELAGCFHVGGVCGVASQTQGYIGLGGDGDVLRAFVIGRPGAVVSLAVADPAGGGSQGVFAQDAEELAEQEVFGFYGGVGFQVAFPPAVWVLAVQQGVYAFVAGFSGRVGCCEICGGFGHLCSVGGLMVCGIGVTSAG